jgi:hypothetical protein
MDVMGRRDGYAMLKQCNAIERDDVVTMLSASLSRRSRHVVNRRSRLPVVFPGSAPTLAPRFP